MTPHDFLIEQHRRPTDEQLQLLNGFERSVFRVIDSWNATPALKQGTNALLRLVGRAWVYQCIKNLTHIVGMERMQALHPDRGVLLVSNHRSFFDLYVVACWLYDQTQLINKLYFPVRSDYFYETVSGFALNGIMSGLSMYPPIFRDRRKADFNKYCLSRIAELLADPGTVVGIHPEGTRGKGPDPYELLPAQPGVGKIVLDAKPIVIPIFINGLGNRFVEQVKYNLRVDGDPVIIVFGEPLNLDEFYARGNRLRTQKEVADHLLDEIRSLGDVEKTVRAALTKEPLKRGPHFYPYNMWAEWSQPPSTKPYTAHV